MFFESWGGYRYGFNGKENDNEVSGAGNKLDFGARVYDSRLGKWLSVDPLTTKYPSLSPYQYALNNPTASLDPDGEDVIRFVTTHTYYSGRESSLDGGVGSIRGYVKTHHQVIIEPAKGPDKFFVDVVKTNVDAHGGFHKHPVQSTQFYPNGDGPDGQGGLFQGTGITKSPGGLLPFTKINDDDFTSLAKLAPESLVKYLEGHNPKQYGALGLHQAGLAAAELVKGFVGSVLIVEAGLSMKLGTSASTKLYRGLNESNVGFKNALEGNVFPNGGTATPLQHNTISTLNSPYTSWTTNFEVAKNFALRPRGSGVVLEAQVPNSRLVASPNTKRVNLAQSPGTYVSESEVLVPGSVRGATVQKVNN